MCLTHSYEYACGHTDATTAVVRCSNYFKGTLKPCKQRHKVIHNPAGTSTGACPECEAKLLETESPETRSLVSDATSTDDGGVTVGEFSDEARKSDGFLSPHWKDQKVLSWAEQASADDKPLAPEVSMDREGGRERALIWADGRIQYSG
ncbi:Hypothetical protein D9617_7g031560 [Elsinoe fawcettii]|nr:Hypothetical protein D9617_7g031560 [Elsinoe fawcettii]